MKYKMPKEKLLTENVTNVVDEVRSALLIHNTDSLFAQWGDRIICVYKCDDKFCRIAHDENGMFMDKFYIYESQFKSLYKKFLDNKIECFNYEDILNGCNKFYLKSEEEYNKLLVILSCYM